MICRWQGVKKSFPNVQSENLMIRFPAREKTFHREYIFQNVPFQNAGSPQWGRNESQYIVGLLLFFFLSFLMLYPLPNMISFIGIYLKSCKKSINDLFHLQEQNPYWLKFYHYQPSRIVVFAVCFTAIRFDKSNKSFIKVNLPSARFCTLILWVRANACSCPY